MNRHPRTYDLSHVTRGAGVYYIVNVRNGKCYVGSALSIRGRLANHRNELRRGIHCNSHLQRAWNKYGERSFAFEVLEQCSPSDTLVREQYWIDSLRSANPSLGYNLNRIAGPNGRTGCKNSPETRRKLSLALRGNSNWKAGVKAAAKANRGKPRPVEVRIKISMAHKGRSKSDEAKAKIKANHWSKRSDAAEITERSASKLRGRKLTVEHKAKIAAGNVRRWATNRSGILHATTA